MEAEFGTSPLQDLARMLASNDPDMETSEISIIYRLHISDSRPRVNPDAPEVYPKFFISSSGEVERWRSPTGYSISSGRLRFLFQAIALKAGSRSKHLVVRSCNFG